MKNDLRKAEEKQLRKAYPAAPAEGFDPYYVLMFGAIYGERFPAVVKYCEELSK